MKVDWSADPAMAERQMQAIIFSLVAFAYIDSDFSPSEKEFIRALITRLVDERATTHDGVVDADQRQSSLTHYLQVLDAFELDILSHFSESLCDGETSEQFVISKLKLGCFELFRGFDEQGRRELLGAIDELMHADGVIHANELTFREEVASLLEAPIELALEELEVVQHRRIVVGEAVDVALQSHDHPLLKPFEWDFSKDRDTFASQAAGDMVLVKQVNETLARQRAAGEGRLASDPRLLGGAETAFLDGHVYLVAPEPEQSVDMLVLGDLHGCYSCLKGALLQAGFLDKVKQYQSNPGGSPKPYLVLLGDYIDRGRFSYAGILRAVMQLYVSMPEHVFMLRGNHEYYVDVGGRVLAPVRPSEAMDSIKEQASQEVLRAYMKLFEGMPSMLIFDDILFVHGGIPRDATLAKYWQGLPSLNNAEMRFEMMWSDPSEADAIPSDLQTESARFPFGRRQFQSFMGRIGCSTMVRGHEREIDGFRQVYSGPEGSLMTVFSAGGADNEDLPRDSNYRQVDPKALLIEHRAGVSTFAPFSIDYRRFNRPEHNAFFKGQ